MRVFVTGATGFIGREIVAHLERQDYRVVALCRNPDDLDLNNVEKVQGDILHPEVWEEHLREVDACVHCIGILRAFPAKGITFEAMHYQATLNLLRACGKLGVKRYIHISANGTEKTPTTDYMRSKVKAEQAVRSSSLDWTILRPSVVYGGKTDKTSFVQMLRVAMRGAPVFPYFGSGNYRLAPISTWEIAETIARCLNRPESVGQIYHLGGDEVYTYKALLHLIAEACQSKVKLFPFPSWLMGAAASVLGGFEWFPMDREMLEMLMQGNEIPAKALTQRELGVPGLSFAQFLQRGLYPPKITSQLPAPDEATAPKTTQPLTEDDLPQ